MGLISHYSMDDNAADTVIIDSEGYSNGTLVGGKTTAECSVAGEIGTAIDFDGSVDYVDTNATFESIFQSDFSVSLWLKPRDGRPTGRYKDPFGTGSTDFVNLVNCAFGETGRIQFGYAAESDDTDNAITSVVFADGQETWHHLVCIAEQTAPTEVTLSIYFDKEFEDSEILTDITMSNYHSDEKFYIGQVITAGVPQWGSYFDGAIDDVRIYNHALTTTEVLNEYLYDFEPLPSPAVVTKTKFYNTG